MPDPTNRGESLNLDAIDDPHVRRALRTMHQQFSATLQQQQLEIDALLELMLEKHIGSLGEFKRHLVRLQQDTTRAQRLHSAMANPNPQIPGASTNLGGRGIH